MGEELAFHRWSGVKDRTSMIQQELGIKKRTRPTKETQLESSQKGMPLLVKTDQKETNLPKLKERQREEKFGHLILATSNPVPSITNHRSQRIDGTIHLPQLHNESNTVPDAEGWCRRSRAHKK
jgi:hypothetical protein